MTRCQARCDVAPYCGRNTRNAANAAHSPCGRWAIVTNASSPAVMTVARNACRYVVDVSRIVLRRPCIVNFAPCDSPGPGSRKFGRPLSPSTCALAESTAALMREHASPQLPNHCGPGITGVAVNSGLAHSITRMDEVIER